MTDAEILRIRDELPPLPVPIAMQPEASRHFVRNVAAYTPEQMREYGRACIEYAQAWRPIAMAPVDGTEILVSGPVPGEDGMYISVGMMRAGVWVSSWWDEPDDELFPPTHWLPLPPTPGSGK